MAKLEAPTVDGKALTDRLRKWRNEAWEHGTVQLTRHDLDYVLTALASQPAPDHAGLVERLEKHSVHVHLFSPALAEAVREAIAALSRVEPVAPCEEWNFYQSRKLTVTIDEEGIAYAIFDEAADRFVAGKHDANSDFASALKEILSVYATPPAPQPALAEQGDAPAAVTVWVVYADDHDYDCMSQWLVGVYSTEEEAKKAGKADEDRYVKQGNKRSRYNLTIEQTTLALPAPPAASQEGEPK